MLSSMLSYPQKLPSQFKNRGTLDIKRAMNVDEKQTKKNVYK